MVNWRKPTELPDPDQLVWILVQHWKENGPMSCEIYCGEVVFNRDGKSCAIFNNDDIGKGGLMWELNPVASVRSPWNDTVLAWCPVNELPLPEWVPNGIR
jgi:hypothetical protein